MIRGVRETVEVGAFTPSNGFRSFIRSDVLASTHSAQLGGYCMEGFGIILDTVASITWWSTRRSEQLDGMEVSGTSDILE